MSDRMADSMRQLEEALAKAEAIRAAAKLYQDQYDEAVKTREANANGSSDQ